MNTSKGKQLSTSLGKLLLMFAKISNDNVAYVSNHIIYLENLNSNKITPLTTDGTDKIINRTFDWFYE